MMFYILINVVAVAANVSDIAGSCVASAVRPTPITICVAVSIYVHSFRLNL